MPKITDLNEYTTPTFSDLLPIVDLVEDETKKVSLDSIFDVVKYRPMEMSTVSVTEQLTVGSTVDNATIDEMGKLRLNGGATAWTDILVPLTTARIGVNTKPDYIESELAYGFPQNDTTERLYFTVQFPHTWKEGSTIYPHIHWKQTQNLAPLFTMGYKWFNIGENIPATWTAYNLNRLAFPYTSGDLHQINDNPVGVSGVGKKISSFLLIQLYRNDNVYTGDALTYQFDIHYQIDSFGSGLEYIK